MAAADATHRADLDRRRHGEHWPGIREVALSRSLCRGRGFGPLIIKLYWPGQFLDHAQAQAFGSLTVSPHLLPHDQNLQLLAGSAALPWTVMSAEAAGSGRHSQEWFHSRHQSAPQITSRYPGQGGRMPPQAISSASRSF